MLHKNYEYGIDILKLKFIICVEMTIWLAMEGWMECRKILYLYAIETFPAYAIY